MNCDKIKENLNRFLDNELKEEALLEIKNHLASCPLCKMTFEKEQRFVSFIKNYSIQEKAPFELRKKILNQISQKKRQNIFETFRLPQWIPGAALGGALVIVLVFGVLLRQSSFPVFSASVINHIDYLKGSYPLEFQTSNPDEAMHWFMGKVDFAPMPPHIAFDKIQLLGGRILNVKDRKAAYYVFEKDNHIISASYLDLKGARLPHFPKEETMEKSGHLIVAQQEKGYSIVLCLHKDGTACIFVSDLPAEELIKLLV